MEGKRRQKDERLIVANKRVESMSKDGGGGGGGG